MIVMGTIGLLIGITVLIALSYKGVNAFVASLIATVVVIIFNLLPFWPSFMSTYATGMKNFTGSFFLLFGLAAAYGEMMQRSGSAESVAATLFKLFGAKWAPIACVFVTLVMAMGGITAFVIIFAVYPVAAPLFRKANITKELLPGIFLFASVVLTLCLPGSPTATNAVLTVPLKTNAYAGPIMGIIACIIGAVLGCMYLMWITKRLSAQGIGYIASGSDSKTETDEKDIPPFWSSFLPLVVVIVLMFLLKGVMTSFEAVNTCMLVAMAMVVGLNYKRMKSQVLQSFTTGFWASIVPLMLTAGILGFAAVVQVAPGFKTFVDFSMSLSDKFNPYLSAAIAVNIMAGITGTALGGLQIFTNSMLSSYTALGINVEAFHRLMVIACAGLDTLPHCATFISMTTVCGVSIKGSYPHVFILSVCIPLILAAACIVMAQYGII